MSTFMVMNKPFGSAWAKMTPYLNYCATKGGSLYPSQEERKLYKTAQKAVYQFICRLCDKGFFKVGLNTKINAIDGEEASESDTGNIYYKPKLDEEIKQFLKRIDATASRDTKHRCASCQCTPFSSIPTDEQRRLIEARINSIYITAQSFMQVKIGGGMIVGAKLLGSWL